MRTCRVKPSAYECSTCEEVADYFNKVPNCEKCSLQNKRYVLVNVSTGLFKDYAFVESDGEIEKVSLDRVYDIKEIKRNVRKIKIKRK